MIGHIAQIISPETTGANRVACNALRKINLRDGASKATLTE
jgi:hypothetical protein